jgi:hypothetical protein
MMISTQREESIFAALQDQASEFNALQRIHLEQRNCNSAHKGTTDNPARFHREVLFPNVNSWIK